MTTSPPPQTDQVHAATPKEATAAEVGAASLSPWRLMARRFSKHRLAAWSLALLILLYGIAAFCEFIAPYTPQQRRQTHSYAPPQRVHLFDQDGVIRRPFVYALVGERDPITHRKIYHEDRSQPIPIRLFVRGGSYHFWGLFETDLHLLGVEPGQTLFLLGTDTLGRDMLSRILYGARISLTLGLVGVALSFVIGLIVGVTSGYFGGWVDNLIQRFIEILRSFPTLPLWMALSAAVPSTWSPAQVYFGITLVLSMIGWGGLARQVRGKVLSLRDEDYVAAAEIGGAEPWRIMRRHLLPGMASHIIVSLTLAVPAMILAETALSFLGLGIRPPAISWGVLLQDAQNVEAVALHPWLLLPVVFVIGAVLAFNFIGDGLRDAVDPHAN